MPRERMQLCDGEIRLRAREGAVADPSGLGPVLCFDILRVSDGVRVGSCDLRAWHSPETDIFGNISYTVFAPYRGHRYAGKACRLLFSLAEKLGMGFLNISCSPSNLASARTCLYAGCRFVRRARVPENDSLYASGYRELCVYRADLNKAEDVPRKTDGAEKGPCTSCI